MDDPDVRYLAKNDPALFVQRYTPPVLIDEIQYATELLPYIKMSVDRFKRIQNCGLGNLFLTIVAAHTSKPVVYEKLADAAGISAPTAKKWLSLDTGLAAYLLKWGARSAPLSIKTVCFPR